MNARSDRARDALVAVVLGLFALALYVACLPPSYAFWDTGEMQTVSAILGIAHPPGSPAFVMLGWMFAHALPFGEPAWRVTVLSSAAVAVAVGVLFATMRRLNVPPLMGALCTLAFACSSITWRYATRAEVHDLALCFSACAIYFSVGFVQRGRRRDLFWSALATGAFAATHGVALLFVPALALAVAARRELRSPRAVATIAGGIALGLLPYAYIAPRSAWLFAHHVDPTLSLAIPAGQPFWDYGHPATAVRFWRFVTGADFHVGSGFRGYLAPIRYLDYAGALVHRLGAAYGYAGTITAAVGAVVLALDYGLVGRALVLAALLPVPYTEAYADLQDPDRYYLLALWCAAIAIAVAFERIAALLGQPRLGIVRAGMGLGLAGAFVLAGPARAKMFLQRQDYTAPRYVEYVRTVTPDDAVVLAEWAYATPLAYASYVEHSFGHRIVVASGPAQYASSFARWLAQGHPLYLVSFDADQVVPAPHALRRVSFDQIYYVYRVLR